MPNITLRVTLDYLQSFVVRWFSHILLGQQKALKNVQKVQKLEKFKENVKQKTT